MVGLAAPIHALVGAAIVAFAQGDHEPLAALFKRFGRLPFPERELRLLSALRAVLADEHRTFDEAFALLQADGNRAEELPALLDLLEAGRIVSPATFGEMLERVEAQSLAVEVGALAPRLLDGSLSIPNFFARIDRERADLESSSAKGDDFFKFEIANAPSLEPPLEPTSPLVDGLLFPGFTVLAAPPKTGKTWFALLLSNCLANGIPLFGREARQCSVCWIQVDMSRSTFRDYASALRLGMNFPETPVPTLFDSRLNLMDEDHQRTLLARLRELKPGLVVVDSLRASAPTLKENDSDSMTLVARKLFVAGIRDGLGASVLLLHHTPKHGTGARGSNELSAAADSILNMTAAEGGTISVHGRGRHSPVELHFSIVDNTPQGGGVLLEPAQQGTAPGRSERYPDRRVEDFLRTGSEFLTVSEISKQARVRFETAKSETVRLFGRGLLEHDGGPEGKRRWRWDPNCRPLETSQTSRFPTLPLDGKGSPESEIGGLV